MILFIKVIIAYGILEISLHFLLRFLRSDFKWLILKSVDEKPIIDSAKIEKFILNSYDKDLGWIRKPNTSGTEKVTSQGQSLNENELSTSFSINDSGCRTNTNHENLPIKIACYGDSFAFARHVNDNETWEWYLSELTNTNVLNYGVGNYGLDQSIIRLQREFEKNKAEITVIAVVPETICRIQSVWKHYSEYGNLLGFKPRFVNESNTLKLIPNLMDNEKKIYDYLDYLNEFRRNDYFYKNKFKKDILGFPYSFSLLKNIKRNIPLIFTLLLKKISMCKDCPWKIILKENFKQCLKQYKNKESVDLLLSLIEYYKDCAEQVGTKAVFVFMPYLNDLKYAKIKGSYYSDFCKSAKDKIPFLDLTEHFLNEPDSEKLYTNDFYGGHLSALGNKKAAEYINEFIEKEIATK